MLQSFLLVSAAVTVLYLLGCSMGHKPKKAKYKEEPYAAGMDLPIIRQMYESKVAHFALVFLIFDILAFMFVISKGTLYPVLYMVIVLLGIMLVAKNAG